MPPDVLKRIVNRLRAIILRLNRHNILSRRFRVFVYRDVCGMKIGANSALWAGNRFNVADTVTIGRNTIIGPDNVFLARGGITIGDNVNLSGFGFFISQTHDAHGHDYQPTVMAPIVICDHVWVATNATILPGVTIGAGAVVAAGSVVTKNVEPWTIVAGNPARVIGTRDAGAAREPLKTAAAIQWL